MNIDTLSMGGLINSLMSQSNQGGQVSFKDQDCFKAIIGDQLQKLGVCKGMVLSKDQGPLDLLSSLTSVIQELDKLSLVNKETGLVKLSSSQDKEFHGILLEIKRLLSDLQEAQEMGSICLNPDELVQLRRVLSELLSFLKKLEQEDRIVQLRVHHGMDVSNPWKLSSMVQSKEVNENKGTDVGLKNNLDAEDGRTTQMLSQLRNGLEAVVHKELDLEKGKSSVQMVGIFTGAQKNYLIDRLSKIKGFLRKVKDNQGLGEEGKNNLAKLGVNLQVGSESEGSGVINGDGIVGGRYSLFANREMANEMDKDKVSVVMMGERGTVSSDKQGGFILGMDRPEGILSSRVPASDVSVARVVMTVKHLLSMNKIPGGMRIRLHPPELGNLRIDVKLDKGVLLVQLQAEKEGAHHLIKSHLNEIRGQLANLGQFQDIKVEILPNHGLADSRSENYLNWNNGQRRYYQGREKGKTESDGFSDVFSEIINAIA